MPLADTTADFDLTDTHVHVFDPARFAYAPERTYTPGAATFLQLQEHCQRLRVRRMVLVQPSVYGVDNACLLDALSSLGPDHARGIAVADLQRVARDTLRIWDGLGVRGLRLNLEVRHEADPERVRAQLRAAAAAVDLEGWCVQIHCASPLLSVVEELLPAFRVPLVLDHLAGLRAADAAAESPALRALLRLLDSGRVYVKLSAFYRASKQAPLHGDLAPLVQALIATRADRLLWGSDWPHTGGGSNRRDAGAIEPFRVVDLTASLAALRSWCPDATVLRRILEANPAELYGFSIPAFATPRRGNA